MEKLKENITQNWAEKTVQETLDAFLTSTSGLTNEEALKRKTLFGPNEIAQGKPTPWYILLARQFANPLVYILLIAALMTALMKHFNDTIIILLVLILNAAIGFYQERKAERAINNIKGMTAPKCKVRRNGEVIQINADSVVPGDIIILEEGDRVPADARLILAVRLKIEEAIFTGESIAADKGITPVSATATLADKSNMAFMGTHVTAGRGEGVVVATGMATELGKIAHLVQTADEMQTPLQIKLEEFSHFVAKGVLGICAIIFLSSYVFYRQNLSEVLLNAIALAVSAIPEGLPVVITLVLAIGVRRMAQNQALIRKLPTVETLGSATVICTDKTGTLTRNEMVVTNIFCDFREYSVSGEGYSCEGKIVPTNPDDKILPALIETAVLCNNASLKKIDNSWKMVGDGTEGALMTMAGKWNLEMLSLRELKTRVGEIPFDSKNKFMVTICRDNTSLTAHLKGSLEAVIERCSQILTSDGIKPLTTELLKKIEEVNAKYAQEALRVLAFAKKELSLETNIDKFVEEKQEGYTFLGIVGMMDLPRPEAIEAVAKCKQAGIRVVMITGDHAETARAIGKKVGIFDEGMKLLTGAELQKLSDQELFDVVESVAIYARTSPEDKMRIIKALQAHGHVVSMTGDGVNDAPALTRADIGVAMGQTGTDVAKEAAGMVLVDDNFASIVAAVEEGRIIFNNLRKAIGFLASTNLGEVLTLLIASLIGLPAPLRAVQILWVNLVTDGFTTIALGVDPPEGDEMTKPPRNLKEPLLSKEMREQIILVSFIMCVGTLIAFYIGKMTGTIERGQTMAFGAMVFFQLFNIYNCRSFSKSTFHTGLFNNLPLFCAVMAAAILQLAVMYLPFLKSLIGTVTITASELAIIFLISFSVIPFVEILKWLNKPISSSQTRQV